jgi:hypothetical protein
MNEKIKELAEQAGLDMTYPHCIEGDIDELARFAELVLKESTLREISDIGQGAHTDHPMRHWDRTCPACVAEAEKQEPVAYTFSDDVILAKHWTDEDPPSGWTPLYTAPPKRPVKSFTGGIPRYAMDAPIEAKLKEKNT